LSWAEDHRLAASSTNSVSIMELMCDIHSLSQNLVLHRSHIPVPDIALNLDEKLQTSGSTYLWCLKLFLLWTLYKSMQKTPSEHLWWPTPREGNVLVGDEEAAEDEMAEISALEIQTGSTKYSKVPASFVTPLSFKAVR
ncbi:hypothetical protein cypCar_00044349, partial [Cyprinus carpio]